MRFTLLLLAAPYADACSAGLAGRLATADGSTLSLHTDDCSNCDFRLARAPPTSAATAARVLAFRETYPREVSNRTSTYAASALDDRLPRNLTSAWASKEWTDNQTLGFLQPLSHDLAEAVGAVRGESLLGSVEGLYAIVNGAQVSIAESTCTAHPALFNKIRPAVSQGRAPSSGADGAMWDVSALTKAALARCPTARCAIDLMGYLAVDGGFYGQHGLPAEVAANGETLLVADPQEAWVFHVAPLPPDVASAAGAGGDEGSHSAVWVAQRVPDDEFVFVANRFIVRDVTEVPVDVLTPTTRACRGEQYRHSANLFAVGEYLAKTYPNAQPLEELKHRGVWRQDDGLRVLDFLVTFGGDTKELAPYTNDRVWRVLSLLAGDRTWEWPPRTPLATGAYPFSAKPSKPITREDFIKITRDLYRGAEHEQLDLTRGLAAGPWGDPSRYDVAPSGSLPPAVGGNFPRAISMFRTSYSHVVSIGRPTSSKQAAGRVGASLWASQGAPHAGIYTPIHVLPAMFPNSPNKIQVFPRSLSSGSLHRADVFDPSPEHASVFWRTTVTNNWARAVGYDFAWALIEAAQREAETTAEAITILAEEKALKAASDVEAAAILAAADHKAAAQCALAGHELINLLMTKLHDGYHVDTPYELTITVGKMFYQSWWLEKVGYYKPPLYPTGGVACE